MGPLAFITCWAALGAAAERYDPTRDAISGLAALDAPTRPAMTAGLLALGAGMALYGLGLRPRRGWLLPLGNGATAVAVAALPLGGRYDAAHGVAAALGYVTLAAIPVALASREARLPLLATAVCGLCLLASGLVDRDGLFQRAGLTVGHLWVVVSALGLLRSPTSSSTTRPAPAPAARRR